MIKLDYLNWDSDFFEKKIFRCQINKNEIQFLNDELNKHNADLCYVFSKEDLNIKNDNSFFLVDRKVIYHKKIDSNEIPASLEIISYHNLTPHLLHLAILSGQYSRFKLDPQLTPKFNDMYKLWIQKSLSREIANEVFVFESEGKELGFVTIKKANQVGIIGLIAVDTAQQGKKIGSCLLNQTEQWCKQNNINVIEVATQMDNEKACAFYTKNGYSIKQIEYIYHYYKK